MSTNKSDLAAVIGKGVVGAIPFVGPLAAEVVGSIIPNQRIDRIEKLLVELETKISVKEQVKVKDKLNSEESIDILEDGFIFASRALSQERLDYIASLLKNSLTEPEVKHIEYKRLLGILGQLNDIEILTLKSYVLHQTPGEEQEFWKKHGDIIRVPPAVMGSTQDEIDKYVIHQTHKNNLVALNLLKPRFKKPKKGEFPEFDDKTGMIKASSHEVTSLGRLFLRAIDQLG